MIELEPPRNRIPHRDKVNKEGAPAAATATEALPEDKLEERVNHFETQIVAQLRNAAVDSGKSVLVRNSLFVRQGLRDCSQNCLLLQ